MNQANIDWEVIKKILCDVVDVLKKVCEMLPDGLLKVILNHVVSLLEKICNNLPMEK